MVLDQGLRIRGLNFCYFPFQPRSGKKRKPSISSTSSDSSQPTPTKCDVKVCFCL